MTNTEPISRITLTAQQFIDAWNSGYKGIKEDDGKGYWEDLWKNVVFDNVQVIENIYIPTHGSLPYLSIKNSNLKVVRIDNSTTGGFTFENTIVEGFYLYIPFLNDL